MVGSRWCHLVPGWHLYLMEVAPGPARPRNFSVIFHKSVTTCPECVEMTPHLHVWVPNWVQFWGTFSTFKAEMTPPNTQTCKCDGPNGQLVAKACGHTTKVCGPLVKYTCKFMPEMGTFLHVWIWVLNGSHLVTLLCSLCTFWGKSMLVLH